MQVVLVTIGETPHPGAAEALRAAGAQVTVATLGGEPSRTELDAVLNALDGRRMVLDAAGPDLALMLRRMMRRGELAAAETAVLRADGRFLRSLGVPNSLAGAADAAVHGQCRRVGVLKDDSGNLVVDSAELRPWSGQRVWVRAYVDDKQLCDGDIAWLKVAHRRDGGLAASVPGRLGRARTVTGRALQLACDDAAISSDGSAREQPRRKRIWWDEPEQWRLAVPETAQV